MDLKYYKPYNSSSRNMILLIHKNYYSNPLKSKCKGIIKICGRNHKGKITMFSKGGGNKRRYRKIEFQSNSKESLLIESIEQDPNRSAMLARLFSFKTKKHSYIISPEKFKRGQLFNSKSIKLGANLSLKDMPIGSKIHCIGSSFRQKKAILQRSAGTFSQIIQKSVKYCLIRLSSGKIKKLLNNTRAIIGIVSNINYKYLILGKAGKKRFLGLKPKTRGVAMNPIDHPHGGGEGRSSGGRPSVTPWAKPAHGKKTRKKLNVEVKMERS